MSDWITLARRRLHTKVARIGYLLTTDPATDSARIEGIRLALRELGYIEGQNIAIEYRFAEGRPEREPELAAELVRLKIDIIVGAGGTRQTRAAKNATKTIPIVMTGLGADPVEAGLIESRRGDQVIEKNEASMLGLNWNSPTN